MPGGTYRLYGLAVRSPLALRCPRDGRHADVAIRRVVGPTDWRFGASRASPDWFSYQGRPDGSALVRWRGLSEFSISADGARLAWRRLPKTSDETFRGYLLPQVLSFSLLARGLEPLHGSAVVVREGVVAFLGDCGLGKSSLTAAFLQAGFPMVTDDLLVLVPGESGYLVEPGVGSIKLAPRIARRLLGRFRAGPRMVPAAAKRIIPLPSVMSAPRPLPLRALYVLSRGRSLRITSLTPSAAFWEIVRAAFNTVRLDPGRLASQFRFAGRLARWARVRLLAYPRRLESIEGVRDAVLADLARGVPEPRPPSR